MKTFVLNGFARRLPDPTLSGVERHFIQSKVLDVPVDLPRDPNPRAPKINRSIWREIKRHLYNEEGTPNTFHLKNKGITIVAQEVKKIGDDQYRLVLSDGDGIVDGGHTYELLMENRPEIQELNADSEQEEINQYITIQIFTGLSPDDLVTEIAGGLNTGLQVQEYSLANSRGEFEWIDQLLQGEPYYEDVGFRENEDAEFDVRDILRMLYMFNIWEFPDDFNPRHPTDAYRSKKAVLQHYLANQDQYRRMKLILKDILTLHDTVGYEARALHNEQNNGKAGALTFMGSRKRGAYQFPFIGEVSQYQLKRAALYPILAAFRHFVVEDQESGELSWTGSFDRVLDAWRQLAGPLMVATQQTNADLGHKANAIGRSTNHWNTIYMMVRRLRGQVGNEDVA